MRDFLDRYRATMLGFVALVLPLFLLYAHGRSPRRTTVVEHGLLRVTGPVQEAAAEMLTGLSDLWGGYIALTDVHADNERLAEDNRVLTAEALRAKELQLENERLRALVGFKRARRDLVTVGAHVIGKDVSPYARVLRVAIDVGEDDRVREGMPVAAAEGLVGRIGRVSGRYAAVMLTADPASKVNVRVAGKGVTGTLQGSQDSSVYAARLLYLHAAEAIEVGDTLVTSGHDKVFPPGIEVGYVRSLEERQRGVYYELQVTPAVNFSALDEVVVVTGVRDGPAAASASDDAAGEGAP